MFHRIDRFPHTYRAFPHRRFNVLTNLVQQRSPSPVALFLHPLTSPWPLQSMMVGQHQSGDTCYYTPTKLEGFGFAEVLEISEGRFEPDHLFLLCYNNEGHGAKGGINVASMIMKSLKKLNMLQGHSNGDSVCGNELNIVMDNCGGQTKNKAPYLLNLDFQSIRHALSIQRISVIDAGSSREVLGKCKYITV
jgi:hypothetical protein